MSTELWSTLLPLFLALPRIAALFIILPIFGRRTLNGIIRNEFILVLAFFIYPNIEATSLTTISSVEYSIIVLKEVFVGTLLGIFAGTFLWVAENIGHLIDLQSGTENLHIFDPINDHEEGPTAGFMLHFVLAMMFAGGGFLMLLDVLFQSYVVWPVDKIWIQTDSLFVSTVSAQMDSLFALTVKYAAPIILLLLLIDVGLGFLNRVSQHLDVNTLSMPIKSTVSLLVLLVFVTFIYESLKEFFGANGQALKILSTIAQ